MDDKKDNDQDFKYNPWHPMTNAIDLKHLGKLAEECGELSSAISRCIIQGVYEKEPETKKQNKQWLTEEIADVFANINLVISHFDLDEEFITKRAKDKAARLKTWHDMA